MVCVKEEPMTTVATPDEPRATSAARDRILDTAFRLFYARGLRAVGVDTIIAESGVAKATFYRHFPAKDDLILAYLDKVDRVWTGQLEAAAQAAGPEPGDQLVGLFDALTTACRRPGYRGCAFINAAAETAPGSPVHDRTVAHKQNVLTWIRDLAQRAGRTGSRPAGTGADPPAGRWTGKRRPGRRPNLASRRECNSGGSGPRRAPTLT